MKQYKQWVGKATLFGLVLSTLFPASLLAKIDRSCPTDDIVCARVVNAKRVATRNLDVRDKADVCGDLCVGNDVEICGNLRVKGKIKDGCPKKRKDCADYIVVGVGGAGAPLIRELTNDKKTSVIALEAGDNNNTDEAIQNLSFAGLLTTGSFFFPNYFFQGQSIVQEQLDNQVFKWTNGRLLGGGSSINTLVYVKGSPQFWQDVADILGPDWSVDKVFARYKELETYTGPLGPGPNTRGSQGCFDNRAFPLNENDQTADAAYLTGAMSAASQSAYGIGQIVDYNNPLTPLGITPQQQIDAREQNGDLLRESTATAFLGPGVMTPEGIGVNGRKLRVHLNATAVSLIWHKKKVIGVRYTQDGECFDVFAKKEVILCTGFQTAEFLQREGIGPENVLDAAGVPVRVANENVGRHLLNHPIFGVLIQSPNVVNLNDLGGPISLQFGPDSFLPAAQGGDRREIQWLASRFAPGNVFNLGAFLLQPESEGTIDIQNRDPLKIPLTDVNYLVAPADIDTYVAALKTYITELDDFFQANPAPGGVTWQLLSPTRAMIDDPNETALRDLIRTSLVQAHHWSTSVRMGSNPNNGALDARGRVFGVKGLRVADASNIPLSPDGNLLAPSMLVGWTIAEFIKEDNC